MAGECGAKCPRNAGMANFHITGIELSQQYDCTRFEGHRPPHCNRYGTTWTDDDPVVAESWT